MIIVSPETHSLLFLIKGNLQKEGKNITLDEVMKVLIDEYKTKFNVFKLEEKEWQNYLTENIKFI